MEIKLTESEAAKITRSRSIRISLLEERQLASMGLSPGEALRKGLDMVLGRADAPVSAPIKPVSDGDLPPDDGLTEDARELWNLHREYLDTAETRPVLDRAWADFDLAMDEIGQTIPGWIRDYCQECYSRFID